MTRRRVIVDTETTGLDPDRHVAVEVAWHDLATGRCGRFIPRHGVLDRWRASPAALRVNGYAERIKGQPQDSGPAVADLHAHLTDATLVGSNPSFDARMLEGVFRRYGWSREQRTPWHHRHLDLAAFAMGRLKLDEPPGLAKVCELLDVDPPDHTAEGDVRATGECLRKLEALAVGIQASIIGRGAAS